MVVGILLPVTARMGSAFVPVHDPHRSAAWYTRTFGVEVRSADARSAVLVDQDGRQVTLLGPLSGIRATPGLPWASCSFVVDDAEAFRGRCVEQDLRPGPVEGDPEVCLFLTLQDPDDNVVLVVDR